MLDVLVRAVSVGASLRTFHLFVPRCTGGGPFPVLVHFAGFGQLTNNSVPATALGWSALAQQHCFAVALPLGTEDRHDGQLATSWNAAGCSGTGSFCAARSDAPTSPFCGQRSCSSCGQCSWCSCSDDLSFVEAMIQSIRNIINVSSFVASGFSNGAMMVYEVCADDQHTHSLVCTQRHKPLSHHSFA